MSPESHVTYQPRTAPFVPFVSYVAPKFYLSDAIYAGLVAVARLMGRGFKAHRAKMRMTQAVDTLERLDDHTLNDIGLRRWQIGRVARLAVENPAIDYRILCR